MKSKSQAKKIVLGKPKTNSTNLNSEFINLNNEEKLKVTDLKDESGRPRKEKITIYDSIFESVDTDNQHDQIKIGKLGFGSKPPDFKPKNSMNRKKDLKKLAETGSTAKKTSSLSTKAMNTIETAQGNFNLEINSKRTNKEASLKNSKLRLKAIQNSGNRQLTGSLGNKSQSKEKIENDQKFRPKTSNQKPLSAFDSQRVRSALPPSIKMKIEEKLKQIKESQEKTSINSSSANNLITESPVIIPQRFSAADTNSNYCFANELIKMDSINLQSVRAFSLDHHSFNNNLQSITTSKGSPDNFEKNLIRTKYENYIDAAFATVATPLNEATIQNDRLIPNKFSNIKYDYHAMVPSIKDEKSEIDILVYTRNTEQLPESVTTFRQGHFGNSHLLDKLGACEPITKKSLNIIPISNQGLPITGLKSFTTRSSIDCHTNAKPQVSNAASREIVKNEKLNNYMQESNYLSHRSKSLNKAKVVNNNDTIKLIDSYSPHNFINNQSIKGEYSNIIINSNSMISSNTPSLNPQNSSSSNTGKRSKDTVNSKPGNSNSSSSGNNTFNPLVLSSLSRFIHIQVK